MLAEIPEFLREGLPHFGYGLYEVEKAVQSVTKKSY